MTPAGSPVKTIVPQRNSTDGMLPPLEKKRSGSLRVPKKSESDSNSKNVFTHQRNASIDSSPV